jgi:hypothetical protein
MWIYNEGPIGSGLSRFTYVHRSFVVVAVCHARPDPPCRHHDPDPGWETSCSEDLLAHQLVVPDPRKPRHSPRAVVSVGRRRGGGSVRRRSFTAIGERAADAFQQALPAIGVRPHPRTGRYVASNEATLRRALQGVDPDAVDDAFAAWLASREHHGGGEGDDDVGVEAVALDGKTVRDARERGDHERAPHLVAAVSHRHGTVLAQRQVDSKSNEITAVRPLLTDLDLAGKLVIADALHTQRSLP